MTASPWVSAGACQPLSNRRILSLWDQGEHRHPADRALLLAAAGFPSLAWNDLVRLPLGWRDCLIIQLRHATLGPEIPVAVQCSVCQERLEFSTSADELMSSLSGQPEPATAPVRIEIDGWSLLARPLNSLDLALLPSGLSRDDARRALVRSTILEARAPDSRAVTLMQPDESLPAQVEAALMVRLLEADPASSLHFALSCPVCHFEWTAVFDITTYFWKELSAMAHDLLQDVHTIASAYGWSEADILALSSPRRAFYLSRITP